MTGNTVAVPLPKEIFDVRANIPLMHQVVVAQLAAARQGTHSTKARGEVRGGGAKPYRQKGTGRARQGSTRAPQFAGGGVAHGPHPRDYAQRTPKKMKVGALRGALSDRARHDRVHVIDGLVTGSTPSTKQALACLSGLSERQNFLVVLARGDEVSQKSVRNLSHVHVLVADQLNTYDVLCAEDIVFTKTAFDDFVTTARVAGRGPEAARVSECDSAVTSMDGVSPRRGASPMLDMTQDKDAQISQLLDAAHEAARQQMGTVQSHRSIDPKIDGWSISSDAVEFVAIERHLDHVLITWPSTLTPLEAVDYLQALASEAVAVYAEGDHEYLAFETPDESADWKRIAAIKDLRYLRADLGSEILVWKAPPREGLHDNRFQVVRSRVEAGRLMELIKQTTRRDVAGLLGDYLGDETLDFNSLNAVG